MRGGGRWEVGGEAVPRLGLVSHTLLVSSLTDSGRSGRAYDPKS